MHDFIIFIFGLMLGGALGITFMCMLQINRLNDNNKKSKENENEKKH